eukprot:Pompholyxophrys_sp_v1_NODE_1_length_32789_cov_6.460653.p27 type:complete len:165 gc:universal NODE_1_length_32789_cov_6.460653:29851-29357(-)
MDNKKAELRRRLRARIRTGQNLRSGTITKEQMVLNSLGLSQKDAPLAMRAHAGDLVNTRSANGTPMAAPSLADMVNMAKSKQLSGTVNNKQTKKAKKQMRKELNTQLVSNIVESMNKMTQPGSQIPQPNLDAKSVNQIKEIPQEKVDKVLLTGSDDESVSSNLD